MSRLGDLIRLERTRSKLTCKQVAKKCGISESYLMAVEAGTRIIPDDQARRILKAIGLREQTEADFSLDDIAATVDLVQAGVTPAKIKPVQKPKAAPEAEIVASSDTEDKGVAGSVWLDALTSVLKRVPVMNAVMKTVDYRLLPITDGRIEGANPDKVFYYLLPDNSLRGFRIHTGDIALIVPAQSPIDGAIMLLDYKGHRILRSIRKLDATNIMLQSYDSTYENETVSLHDLTILGRAVRVEFSLI